jgi:hypothetical protein
MSTASRHSSIILQFLLSRNILKSTFFFDTMKWLIISLTLVISVNAFAQNKIQGSLGVNYPVEVDGSDNVLYEYWKFGINAGVNAHIKILEPISFRPGLSYQYLFFHKYVQYIYYGRGAVSSTGTGSHVVKLGGELHFGDVNEENIRLSLFLGGGYAMESPGRMTIVWADYPTGGGSLPNRNYWYGSAGINFEFSIAKAFSIGTSVKYFRNKAQSTSSYATDDTLWMVNCSVLYDIMKF